MCKFISLNFNDFSSITAKTCEKLTHDKLKKFHFWCIWFIKWKIQFLLFPSITSCSSHFSCSFNTFGATLRPSLSGWWRIWRLHKIITPECANGIESIYRSITYLSNHNSGGEQAHAAKEEESPKPPHRATLMHDAVMQKIMIHIQSPRAIYAPIGTFCDILLTYNFETCKPGIVFRVVITFGQVAVMY